MAYVAPTNQLEMLSTALTGAAKGASDFAQLKMRRDQMAQQQKQFDANLEFGFKRLDEQIRQFDVNSKERKELEAARRDLQATLKREELDVSLQRAQMQKEATLGSASIRQRQAEVESLRAYELHQRNYGTAGLIDAIEGLNAHELGQMQQGPLANEVYEQMLDQKALDVANHLKLTGDATPDEVRMRREQIVNYKRIKEQHIQTTAAISAAKRNQAMMNAGAYGPDFTDTGASPELPQEVFLTDDGTFVAPPDNWDKILSATWSNDPFGSRKISALNELKGEMGTYGQARYMGLDNRIPLHQKRAHDLLNKAKSDDIFGSDYTLVETAFFDRMRKLEAIAKVKNEPGWTMTRFTGTIEDLAESQAGEGPYAEKSEAEATRHAEFLEQRTKEIDAARRQKLLAGTAPTAAAPTAAAPTAAAPTTAAEDWQNQVNLVDNEILAIERELPKTSFFEQGDLRARLVILKDRKESLSIRLRSARAVDAFTPWLEEISELEPGDMPPWEPRGYE